MDKNKTCCIFNLAPHYRTSIYKLMDIELKCDFYFGDRIETQIKLMNYDDLFGFKNEVKNKKILNSFLIWQKDVVPLVFKKKYKYFILTGDSKILSNWFIAFFALLLNKKVFLWMHGMRSEFSWKGKLLNYPLYYLSNKFLLYSDFSKSIMISEGFPDNKMICIYNSLNYDVQIAIRRNLKKTNIYKNYFNNDEAVIIYIGRIQKIKKINLLVEAISTLKEKNVFCNLVIVGLDTENVNIEKMISDHKLKSNIWMYGPCYDENKIGELIYNADVCVSPGNIGLTAMHVFTYGTPAITHNNFSNQMPEFEIIAPGVTGDFFKENNVDDLCVKIQNWINLDDNKRERVRLAAFKQIDDRYNPHYQIKVLKKLIKFNE